MALSLLEWRRDAGGGMGDRPRRHVGIGLGDYPYTRFGKPHNGELVEMVAKMAHIQGREVATPAQARQILKMPPRPQLPDKISV